MARHGARKENAKVRNRRLKKKVRCWSPQDWVVGSKFQPHTTSKSEGNSLWLQYNGTAAKPRLSVFCSNRQLYAMLVADHGKKILFCCDHQLNSCTAANIIPLKFDHVQTAETDAEQPHGPAGAS